ncbi:DUF6083 domain-containing protein [Streptomyces atriruber]|uniref:DUF6083 domain-containing protein n=1 Tax=Streptomyces atriruber TaxID=545121 RepID=UPI001FCA2B1C|nr:DUF6083 domain-containing protein [Streptomyces atriruber]
MDPKELWRTGQDQTQPVKCPRCGLPWEPVPTDDHDRVMLEPDFYAPAHTVPPRQRWYVRQGWAVQDDSCPRPSRQCRIAHALAYPEQELPDLWGWLTALREEIPRQAGRLFQRLTSYCPSKDLSLAVSGSRPGLQEYGRLMDDARRDAAPKPRPDYPPKKPPSPPPPDPPTKQAAAPAVHRRPTVLIANRRAANWALENAPWSEKKAAVRVVEQLRAWGYLGAAAQQERYTAVTRGLARAALGDGGRRITVHVADQEGAALIMVLSHRDGPGRLDESFLPSVAALGVLSCGADTDGDEPGNRRWALLEL